MKNWKICLIGIQLMLAGCASTGGSPPPTGDGGSNGGGGMGNGGGSYLINPSDAP